MRLFLAILVGKIISTLSRALKTGGGSAAPGLYALKIYPELVEGLVKQVPKNVVITGTNGKTTTARILAHLATEAGLKIIRNSTGSNLERGVASSLISHFPLPTSNFQLGIWELDEATFNLVTPKLKPGIVVFLNVFRDQLDRYGEIDSVVKKWCQTLKSLNPKTIVLINGDDANTSKLKSCFAGKVETFGVENYKIVGESLEHIKHPYKLDFEARDIQLKKLEGSHFNLYFNHRFLSINLPLPGVYHIYDAIAAMAAAFHLNLPIDQLTNKLVNFSPAFGRVEKLPFGFIFLIKNPAGATQVFETISTEIKPEDHLLLALNDNLADGRDVSWIWDGGFEKLKIENGKLKIICSGTRAYDLAVRLKYAGFDPKFIEVEPDLEKALKGSRMGLKGRLYILPTYTALLELQDILADLGIKKHYWKEN